MEIELVSKPARELLDKLLKHKNEDNCVSGREYPNLVNLDNPWLYELKELKFLSTDQVPNVIFTNKGLTYLERRKAYRKEVMLTSFWIPILVSLIVSLLVSAISEQ